MSTALDRGVAATPAPAGSGGAAVPFNRPRKQPYRYLRAALITVVCVVFAFPYLWMVLASLKTNVQISDAAQTFLFTPMTGNYANVLGTADFGPYIANSVFVAVASTAVSLVFGVPAAWAIARFDLHRFNGVILLARVVPAILLLVPWYFLFSRAQLVGGYGVLVLSHVFIGLPLVTWVMTGFFKTIPAELDEAGRVDGLSDFGCFLRIALPLALPGLATASILSVIFSWNNFLFSLILASEDTLTLPVALFQFIAYAGVDWGGLMAAAVVMTGPIILFSLVAQKYVVSGLTAGATKG